MPPGLFSIFSIFSTKVRRNEYEEYTQSLIPGTDRYKRFPGNESGRRIDPEKDGSSRDHQPIGIPPEDDPERLYRRNRSKGTPRVHAAHGQSGQQPETDRKGCAKTKHTGLQMHGRHPSAIQRLLPGNGPNHRLDERSGKTHQ